MRALANGAAPLSPLFSKPLLPLVLAWFLWTLCSAQQLLATSIDRTSYLQSIKPPANDVALTWNTFKTASNHDEIVAAAPDTWQALPPELDPAYRNPCWTDELNRFRCMPFFQIIGVSKCGTTDLFKRLKSHPEMAYGAKGPHFWDECPSPPRGACTAPPNGDFDSYINLFQKGANEMATSPNMITGEASSNTYTGVFAFARGLAVRKNVNITLAQLIHEAQPYQRLIVIMRDPISRYYSAFHYYRKKSSAAFEGADKFHKRVEKDMKLWQYCAKRYGKSFCLKRYNPQQLIKGMYNEFVEAWTNVFPKENILFLRTEDYKAAPKEHLQAVMTFLGLRDLHEEEWAGVLGVERANTQSTRYPSMYTETYEIMKEFYKPYNEQLVKLMGGDERYLWNDINTSTIPMTPEQKQTLLT